MADGLVLTTCPRDCYDACGILVDVRGGAIRHVRGDPAHAVSRGRLCRKCSIGYNGSFLDPELRLTRPLRRLGGKGEGRFEPVSWKVALGEIAGRLRELEGRLVLNAHYTGTFSMLGYFFPLRFFNRLGATEVDPDTICNKAGHVALEYVYGSSLDGFDPRTARDASCILVWGANPSASAPHFRPHGCLRRRGVFAQELGCQGRRRRCRQGSAVKRDLQSGVAHLGSQMVPV